MKHSKIPATMSEYSPIKTRSQLSPGDRVLAWSKQSQAFRLGTFLSNTKSNDGYNIQYDDGTKHFCFYGVHSANLNNLNLARETLIKHREYLDELIQNIDVEIQSL